MKKRYLCTVLCSIISAVGCSSHQSKAGEQAGLDSSDFKSEQLNSTFAKTDNHSSYDSVDDASVALQNDAKAFQSTALQSSANQLLPSQAKSGECYARVWVDPKFRSLTKTIVVEEAREQIKVTPAQYEWGVEEVLVSDESTKLVEIPAEYKTISEKILVQEGQRRWVSSLENGKPVSQQLLLSAKNAGIDIESSPVNMCYHEHALPAKVETVVERIEISPASYRIESVPAKYRTAKEQVLVSEASTKIVKVPAKYEEYQEKIIDVPAYTTWKKGKGPIQKLNEATGEIMCLVDVPATYKTVTRRKLVSAEYTTTVAIPAKYEAVQVSKLIAGAEEKRIEIPAQYRSIKKQHVISEPTFVWHEVHNNDLTSSTRTGNKVCLTETQPRYETVSKQVILKPAATKTIVIPATYKENKVRKVVSEAREDRFTIPAIEKTVSHRELESEGYMEWRSILCDTNMTPNLVIQLQKTLNEKGYDVGTADGLIGDKTLRAVNKYQKDNGLPSDKYLNIDTMRHLKVL